MLNLFVSLRFLLAGATCLRVPLETVAGESLDGMVSRSFLLSLWWQNLKAHPNAEACTGTTRFRVRAREARDLERELLWDKLVARDPSYAEYQRRTKRRIPVVVLQPTKRGAKAGRASRATPRRRRSSARHRRWRRRLALVARRSRRSRLRCGGRRAPARPGRSQVRSHRSAQAAG